VSVRERLESALSGAPIERPVYAVYDWFVKNRRAVDWEMLFGLGLGQISHANLIRHVHPNFEVRETVSREGGQARRDVCLVTDQGELREWYLGEWKQEHFIKTAEDYRIMRRALEGLQVFSDGAAFNASEAALGGRGVTVGHLAGVGQGRTPLMTLQVDWVGLERFSIDLACEQPEMLDLLEFMNAIKLEEVRQAVKTPATQIKLWENLSIETLGPVHFRRRLAPVYRRILEILAGAGKRLQVHYDGGLRVIADDVAELDFDGIDSFTEPPEGDMFAAEARAAWPDKFLWQNINLEWYALPRRELERKLAAAVDGAGRRRHCFMISEEVPANWREAVPAALEILQELAP